MRFYACMFMLATFWLFLPPAHSNAAQKEVAIAQSGDTVVRAVSKKKTAEITIRTIKIDKSNIAFPYSAFSWDLKEWEFKEVTIIQSLKISVDGRNILVPRSVFADLVNPRKASVRFNKGQFVFLIRGGDASESYFIRIYFDATKVTRRKEYSALEPIAMTQDTRYYRPVLKDIP